MSGNMDVNKALCQLVESAIKVVGRTAISKKDVRFDKSFFVAEVGDLCPASILGISKGDYLVRVNGGHAIDFNQDEDLLDRPWHTFEFYLSSSHELLKINFNGLPLGVNLKKTTESIINHYNWWSGDPDDLFDLWERFEDKAINHLVNKWVKKNVFYWSSRVPKFLSNAFFLDERETLLAGVGLYENGLHEEGMYYISKYVHEYFQNWTTNYGALALYYLALNELRIGKRDEAIAMMAEAYEYYPLERVENKLKMMGGSLTQRPAARSWIGKVLPLKYTLSSLSEVREVSLISFLENMKPHQLLIVCSLGSYRSNGPYDDFMKGFIRMQKHFDNMFVGLHVITSDQYNRAWLENESKAKSMGLPVLVLKDENDNVAEALQSSISPDIFLLDKSAVVIDEGVLGDEVRLWKLINARTNILIANQT